MAQKTKAGIAQAALAIVYSLTVIVELSKQRWKVANWLGKHKVHDTPATPTLLPCKPSCRSDLSSSFVLSQPSLHRTSQGTRLLSMRAGRPDAFLSMEAKEGGFPSIFPFPFPGSCNSVARMAPEASTKDGRASGSFEY